MINKKYTNLFNQQFECLKQAFVDLNIAIEQDDSLTHFVKARIYHCYDYALEHSLKVMQSYLTIQGDFETDTKVIIEKALNIGLIDNADIWYQMLDDSSSNQDIFEREDYGRVHESIIQHYTPQIQFLIKQL